MSKPIRIYGSTLSPFGIRVVLACAYKGLKFDLGMPKNGLKSADFMMIHPFGKMPAIQDGAVTLFESGVIVDYLDSKYKKKKLIPTAAKANGHARLVGAVASEYVQSPGLAMFRLRRSKSDDATSIETARAQLAKGLDALECTMAGKKFAGGASFTVADCYTIPALFFATALPPMLGINDPIGARPKVRKYWNRVQKDKMCKPILAGMEKRLAELLAG